jgi:methyl-accepting chemotaxis protein
MENKTAREINNLSVAKQLTLLVGLFCVSLLASIILAFTTLSQLQVNGPIYKDIVNQKDLIADILPPPEYLIEAYLLTWEMRSADGDKLKGMVEKSYQLREEFNSRHEFWLKTLPDGKGKDLIANKVYQAGLDFLEIRDKKYIPALLQDEKETAIALQPLMAEKFLVHRNAVDELVLIANQDAGTLEKTAAQSIQSRKFMMAAVNTGLAFSLLYFSWILIKGLLARLGGDPQDVAAVVRKMAYGDFSQQPHKLPESGSLLADAYQMQGKLRDMLAAVKYQSEQVSEMAKKLTDSANQIALNSNQESDAVSSMAAAIEELSVTTTHISDQGNTAKRIATSSRSNAEQGAQVVNKTVAGLLTTAQEIEAASTDVSRLGDDASRISEVVKVIKEIADQTNLLALNAAIEAARAGEQGRGFAVVADEVRKLAERTGGATNEINQMSAKIAEVAKHALSGMDKVVKNTQQGVGDAESAQISIKHIQTSFSEVSGVIDDIAGALHEQNSAATELAKTTERVSQMSEENSSSAQSLLSLAKDLESKSLAVRVSVEAFKT